MLLVFIPRQRQRDSGGTLFWRCLSVCQSVGACISLMFVRIYQTIKSLIQTWHTCKVEYANAAWQVLDILIEKWLNYGPLFF